MTVSPPIGVMLAVAATLVLTGLLADPEPSRPAAAAVTAPSPEEMR